MVWYYGGAAAAAADDDDDDADADCVDRSRTDISRTTSTKYGTSPTSSAVPSSVRRLSLSDLTNNNIIANNNNSFDGVDHQSTIQNTFYAVAPY